MAEKIVLKAERRNILGKQAKALRRSGRLPAVIYGKGVESVPLTMDLREVDQILPTITSSQLIIIQVGKNSHTVLVKERQRSPLRRELLHVDFQAISMTEKLRTSVGLEQVGEAPAVIEQMGVLVTGLENLEVECLPSDLPERIEVDLSVLDEIGATLYVKDLAIPSGVTVLTDHEEMVAMVTYQTMEEIEEEEEEEEEELFGEELEPEVIERGKAVAEGEEGEEE